jgi:hypothetical protein
MASKGSVRYWIKNEGRGVKLGGLDKTGKKKLRKNELEFAKN